MHILKIAPWYPLGTKTQGIFYRDQAQALVRNGVDLGVIAANVYPWHRITPSKLPRLLRPKVEPLNDRGPRGFVIESMQYVPISQRVKMLQVECLLNQLLQKYIRHFGRPDLIHAHCALFSGVIAHKWKMAHGIPYVITEHSSRYANTPLKSWERALVRDAVQHADQNIAVSQGLKKDLSGCLDLEPETWSCIPNLVDDIFLTHRSRKLDPADRTIFLNVGALTEIKGQSILIEAFGRAFPSPSKNELWIVGEGPLLKKLRSVSAALKIADRVQFLGHRPHGDLPGILSRARALVVSSQYETFGVVVAEALVSGTPVIATRCGGPDDIVGDADGLLVQPNSVDEMTEALLRMAGCIDLYHPTEISARGMERFSAETVSHQISEIYSRILKRDLIMPG